MHIEFIEHTGKYEKKNNLTHQTGNISLTELAQNLNNKPPDEMQVIS